MKGGDLVRRYRGCDHSIAPWKEHGLLAHGLVIEIETGKIPPQRRSWGFSDADDKVLVHWVGDTWMHLPSRDLEVVQ